MADSRKISETCFQGYFDKKIWGRNFPQMIIGGNNDGEKGKKMLFNFCILYIYNSLTGSPPPGVLQNT